ncbi:MAG: acetate--CoA ligase family protein [Chloroflexi bacterium]|nr:acetate--CoA ligase family protein [Chloroflexota bacterium]
MARLHEYQGKALLKALKIAVPKGEPARSPEEAHAFTKELASPVVVKGQAWVTGRAEFGAIAFAEAPDEAARAILGMQIHGFQIDTVLVEEKLNIEREFYAGLIIDDDTQSPAMIFSSKGGSEIEEIAGKDPDSIARTVIDVRLGLTEHQARDLVRQVDLHGKLQVGLGRMVHRLYQVTRRYDARAAEINPIVLTKGGSLYAADCRITVDDNAVYRHPDLGIEVAREFDRPVSRLDTIAWQVEKDDYRGTFYFIQLEHEFERGDRVIGFHGAGGGGSMMSMDAILNRGYRLANFVDISGNPPASKVYRAARIVLAQEGIDGYFASGSGVASQEQYHSARGLVKAFMEVPLRVPAVVRLGGNAEDRAIAILERARDEIPAPVEGYGKDDTPEFCAERLDGLIGSFKPGVEKHDGWVRPEPERPYSFETVTDGEVTFDHAACEVCASKICIETCVPGILELQGEVPVLNITRAEAKKGG